MKNFVMSVSNMYITVDSESYYFNFNYKDLIRYDLYWDLNFDYSQPEDIRRPSLIIWEPENQATTITFTGTQEEYNEYIQPLVDLWEAEKQRQAEDQVLQANLALERYDANIAVYQKRIGIALANGDTELVSELQNEMNNLDPQLATQDTSDIRHYCKKCGHDLDAYNVCTNENCKRKQQQDLITQLVEEREAEEQAAQNQEQENQEENTTQE